VASKAKEAKGVQCRILSQNGYGHTAFGADHSVQVVDGHGACDLERILSFRIFHGDCDGKRPVHSTFQFSNASIGIPVCLPKAA
jgi:hypothetical protein